MGTCISVNTQAGTVSSCITSLPSSLHGVAIAGAFCRAKALQNSETSLKQAATQEAEIQAQHKSLLRRSQAAQSPLPPLPGKKLPTAAQSRQRTAAGPRKASDLS